MKRDTIKTFAINAQCGSGSAELLGAWRKEGEVPCVRNKFQLRILQVSD